MICYFDDIILKKAPKFLEINLGAFIRICFTYIFGGFFFSLSAKKPWRYA